MIIGRFSYFARITLVFDIDFAHFFDLYLRSWCSKKMAYHILWFYLVSLDRIGTLVIYCICVTFLIVLNWFIICIILILPFFNLSFNRKLWQFPVGSLQYRSFCRPIFTAEIWLLTILMMTPKVIKPSTPLHPMTNYLGKKIFFLFFFLL